MTITGQGVSVRVQPITDTDLDSVSQFLVEHFPPDSGHEWATAWRETVNRDGSDAPNHGFLLLAGDRTVGAYCAIYSTRQIAGETQHICNLAVWCVNDHYRVHSIRMLRALIGQKGWHFTDLSPAHTVQKLNERLGFKYLDTTTSVAPNLPLSMRRGVRIHTDPELIDSALSGEALTYYRDHATARWARHLVIIDGDDACYVQWRRTRRKGLPLFANVQYVSDPTTFRRCFGSVARQFLFRYVAAGTVAEWRVVGGRLPRSYTSRKSRKRMYRSDTLPPEAVDYLYSELTMAP